MGPPTWRKSEIEQFRKLQEHSIQRQEVLHQSQHNEVASTALRAAKETLCGGFKNFPETRAGEFSGPVEERLRLGEKIVDFMGGGPFISEYKVLLLDLARIPTTGQTWYFGWPEQCRKTCTIR